MPKRSAGVLMYRRGASGVELLLVHPGGPFWKKKDLGAWSIPKGEYAEGDRFLGVTVPQVRRIALRYRDLPPKDLARLLESSFHEHRFAALEILFSQFEKAHERDQDGLIELPQAGLVGRKDDGFRRI